MKRPLLGMTTAFLSGILLEGTLDIPIFYLFAAASGALILSLLFFKSRFKFAGCIALAFLFLGGLDYKNYNTLPASHIKNILPGQVTLKGFIINRPYSKKTYNFQDKASFLLKVSMLKQGDAWRGSSGTVLVNMFGPAAVPSYGDEVILDGELNPPGPATNPGQFDYKKFLERERIFYILSVKKENFCKVTGHKPNPLMAFVYGVKGRIEQLILKFMPPLEGAFLNTVLLGNRQDMDDDINDDFVKTGTVHILSISGLHVALMASILMLALKFLRVPFGMRAVLASIAIILYCLMVDSRPPVLRSTIMILIFLGAGLLKREQDSLNTLSLAALAILLFDPNDIFNIGFQLSFLTVGSIIWAAPRVKYDPKNKMRSYCLQIAAVSFAAWAGSAPLVARYFNIVSPVTVAANLVVVPWVFFVMAVSFVFVLFGSLSYALGLVVSQVMGLSIAVLFKMVSLFSLIPMGYFRVKSPPWLFICGFYLFAVLFLARGRLKLRAKYFLIAALLAADIFTWHKVFSGPRRELRMTFLDVGKGDSIFLEFPGGGTMLIDGGEGLGADMGRIVVNRFLSFNGINSIDIVCATHPHTDHIGGLVNILKNFRARYFMDNGDSQANPLCRQCHALVAKKRIKRFVLKKGDRINGFSGVKLRVLNPPAAGKLHDANNNSLVIRLERGNFSALLCGDIKEEGAKRLLLDEPRNLASALLKVPHHGGALGQAAENFLRKVNPKAAVISGRNKNIDSRILLILKELKTRIYKTGSLGAVAFLEVKK